MTEHHYRSIIKGITWRIVGTTDTVALSFLFTGDIIASIEIGSIEIFTKFFLYYIHERVWLKFKIAQSKKGDRIKDKHHRSVIKGISWRTVGTIDTIIIARLITGDYSKALGIGFTEVGTKIILYYIHERIWNLIKIGKR